MQTETFNAVLRSGHKEHAAEVPFDPGSRWAISAQPLRPGRRGFPVEVELNGTRFGSAIVPRARKFWLLVPAAASKLARVAAGEWCRFAISPRDAATSTPLVATR